MTKKNNTLPRPENPTQRNRRKQETFTGTPAQMSYIIEWLARQAVRRAESRDGTAAGKASADSDCHAERKESSE